jgi:predicted N-acetyltransferase YhbS
MNQTIQIEHLTKEKFEEAVNVVLHANLDTKEEIEHHLHHIAAHYIALDNTKVIGVIGWYQDTVKYATEAMGDKFPGESAYWVGFFAVDKLYKGQGIGYTLLQTLENDLREKGASELWVSSVPETKDYYVRQGFSVYMEGEINGNRKFFCVKKLSDL